MEYYFKLQCKRFIRRLRDLGIHPFLGFVLGLIVFVLLSKLFFNKTELAKWIYPVFYVSMIFFLSERTRSHQLYTLFSRTNYYLLRTIENSIIALPFQIYLLFENHLLIAWGLSLISIIFAFYKVKQIWNRTIPTPFKNYPFEFIVGFRKTFWLIGFAYFLIIKSIQVDNYNLGLFGLGLIFLCSMYYYQKPESAYFVWIYSTTTKKFLKDKFLTSVICISILSTPALIGMLIGFPYNYLTTLLVYFGGYIFLGSMIVAKYSTFPYEMNIPQGIFYALSLMFPLLLLLTIWIFYSQSKKRIKLILRC